MNQTSRVPDPLIVLVPGLGLDDRVWAPVRHRLTGPVRTVLLPSLGRRSPRGMDLTVERQAQRLLSELSGQGVDSVVLVGHSASCPVVVEAAARSQIVAGLVLIGPVTDPRARTWPGILVLWFRTVTHERLHELAVLIPQYWHTGLVSMVRGMNAIRWYRTDHALARLDLPVVVLRGALDRIALQDWSARLSANARGRLQEVDGAGHMVPLTHPDPVVAAVRAVTSAATTASPGAAGGCLSEAED